ncbi:M15 family metallopeptidase [Nesterenkonia ebinurensis]|uniref:M15 family metallopeptidase n=1 Tax=Nesterenkonia ebinurensis TaxID=2608252 RepID=UPI00123E27FD|nr:M15 family metallopeptidase [Nesterenkonia ebinurensis]
MRSRDLWALCCLCGLVLSGCAHAEDEPSGAEPSRTQDLQGTTTPAEPRAQSTLPVPDPTPEPPEPTRASDPSWDPASIHVLVNRQNPLDPVDYTPDDLVELEVRTTVGGPLYLREESAQALDEMFSEAADQGVVLAVTSAYRSFDGQARVYSDRHQHLGTEATDEFAARPGYSEHQTGLAVDVISIENPECIHGDCFDRTPEFAWVQENSAGYGFVIRYPEGAEHITGFGYEPWHLRYVGPETAAEVAKEDLTLEEYWDQPAAPDYDEPEPDLDLLRGERAGAQHQGVVTWED